MREYGCFFDYLSNPFSLGIYSHPLRSGYVLWSLTILAVIDNMQLGALCILLPNENINHIFICRQLCTKSGSKKRTFPG